VHHGKRLAVTAGATVLGIAAMSGVSHAETSPPPARHAAHPFGDAALKTAALKKAPQKKAAPKKITLKKSATPKSTKTTKAPVKAKTRKAAAKKPHPTVGLPSAPP
jgi:hypothetical protein